MYAYFHHILTVNDVHFRNKFPFDSMITVPFIYQQWRNSPGVLNIKLKREIDFIIVL